VTYFREYNVQGYGRVCEFDAYAMPDLLRETKYELWDEPDSSDLERLTDPSCGGSPRFTPAFTEKLFREGWPEGSKMILNIADAIRPHLPRPKDLRRMIAYRDSGDELDVERMYAGKMDSMWRTRKRKYAPTETNITIASHYCTVSFHPSQTILSGGISVALAYLLEQFGYRVEILGLLTICKGGDQAWGSTRTHTAIANFKTAHQALQLDYVAAALHPAVAFRYAKRMVTHVHSGDKWRAGELECNDTGRHFATKWMQSGGRRIDFASDWVSGMAGAVADAKECVETLGGRVFEYV